MRNLARDAAVLLAAALVLGGAANLLRSNRLAWWGQGQAPPQVGVDFSLLDVMSADALRTSLPRVVFIDTRSLDAAAPAQIPGAWRLAYTDLASQLTAERMTELKASDAVILYGTADEGDIEQLLAQELHRRGLRPPYVLVGGFPTWESAGLAVEGGTS